MSHMQGYDAPNRGEYLSITMSDKALFEYYENMFKDPELNGCHVLTEERKRLQSILTSYNNKNSNAKDVEKKIFLERQIRAINNVLETPSTKGFCTISGGRSRRVKKSKRTRRVKKSKRTRRNH